MNKIAFDGGEDGIVEFYVLEQTTLGGVNYILVTESEDEEEAECYIMKDVAPADSADAVYEMVEDDSELDAVYNVFSVMMEDEVTLEK